MQYTYEATKGLPTLITRAENTWVVRPLTDDMALVASRAEVTLQPLPGFFQYVRPAILPASTSGNATSQRRADFPVELFPP
jgi:hypothetical protein